MPSKYDGDKYGTQYTDVKAIKMYYIVFKLLSSEGLKNKQAQDDLGCSDRTIQRLLASCREALYLAYGDDVQIIYSRRDRTYKMIYLKSKF